MKFFISTVALVLVVASALARPNTNSAKRLIKVSETEAPTWMTEDEVFGLIGKSQHFIDITDHQKLTKNSFRQSEFPTELRYKAEVEAVISRISTQRQREFIASFSDFHTRYYTSATGKASSEWLLEQLQDIIENTNYDGVASAAAFSHTWIQTSVIAKIEGADPTLASEVVVLGAHADSVNLFGSGLRSPGADDDASGAVVLFETFRSILESGTKLKRTVEFQFYAAEEVGLRGSQDIAEQYAKDNVNVIAMSQFDVVGYNNGRNEIGIVTDYTNKDLSEFMRLVVKGYCSYPVFNLACGYACSDHASWTAEGFPSAFPVEVVFHPDMHTADDTIESVNFEQVKEFTQLAAGFAVEIAEPTQ